MTIESIAVTFSWGFAIACLISRDASPAMAAAAVLAALLLTTLVGFYLT